MKYVVIICLCIIFFNPKALAERCSSQVRGLKREIPLITKPTYFIRVDTKADKIFMSGDCVLSLKDGRCLSTGRTWEPYPISGMNLVTIPHCGVDTNLCFYKTDDFENQTDSKPAYIDNEMKGYYQSVGFLKRSSEGANVRVLAYYGLFRDYKISGQSISPLGPPKRFCEGIDLKLPMLSKDGKTLSGWNVDAQKTVLYSLKDDGKCKPYYSLDFMVGKMDFSYDNKYVAFHASSDGKGAISDSLEIKQQIFVMNLKSKKIVKLSTGTDILYYPHFGENGLLYALKFNKAADKYSVLEIDIANIMEDSITEANFCIDCSEAQQKKLFKLDCI